MSETEKLRVPVRGSAERDAITDKAVLLLTSGRLELGKDFWLCYFCSVTIWHVALTKAQRPTIRFRCINILGGLHFHLVCRERFLPICPFLNLIKSRTMESLI